MNRVVALLLLMPALALARVEPQTEGEEPILPKRQEAQVTIVQDQDRILEIHQVNGKVYGIRVFPKNGAPYNLVDIKGDGKFIQRSDERMVVPEWVIFSW